MQAEERKDLETNSLAQSLSSMKGKIDGRTVYFLLGTVILIIAGVLLFRYFTKQKVQSRDARVLQLEGADTPDKLKALMEEQRGTIYGSIAKLHIARRALTVDGLEKIGTDKAEERKKAATSLEEARTYFTDLTKEFKQYDEPALLQEAWLGLARAEEALVGLPTSEGGNDSRGDADKAIDAYKKAGEIFPDLELSKKYLARSKELQEEKTKFIEAQKAFYAPPSLPVPVKKEEAPKTNPEPKLELPKIPAIEPKKTDVPKVDIPKLDVPKVDAPKSDLPKAEIPKGDAPKTDPKAK